MRLLDKARDALPTKDRVEFAVNKVRDLWRGSRKYTAPADKILRSIQLARGGSVASKAVAGAAIASTVADTVFPEVTISEELNRLGYAHTRTPISDFVCHLVETHRMPTRLIERGSESAKLWEYDGSGIAIHYYNDGSSEGPYILADDDRLLLELVNSAVWSQGRDLALSRKNTSRYRSTYDLTPLDDLGPYIGEVGPKYWAERLDRYGNRPRTVLIKGPSGVGKSVLARHIGQECTGSSRTLRVSADVMKRFGSAELRALARYLRPRVLLLDDLSMGQENTRYGRPQTMLDSLLDMMESLRVEGCIVVVTKMEDVAIDQEAYRGQHYVEGMRPDRIDEIIVLPPPNEKDRLAIIDYYCELFQVELPAQARAEFGVVSEGLTGAYLKELLFRVGTHGVSQSEVVNVLQLAPPPIAKRRLSKRQRIHKRSAQPKSKMYRTRARNKRVAVRYLAKKVEKEEAAAERYEQMSKDWAQREAEEKKKKKKKAAEKKKAAPKKKVAKKPKKAASKKTPKKATPEKVGLAEAIDKAAAHEPSVPVPDLFRRRRRRRRLG
jgi:hypothetical protein